MRFQVEARAIIVKEVPVETLFEVEAESKEAGESLAKQSVYRQYIGDHLVKDVKSVDVFLVEML